jgi:TolA-binding protein
MSTTPAPGQSGLRSFFRVLLRVTVFLVLLAAIVAGVMIGGPILYRDLVQPVRENSTRLAALEESLAADRSVMLERLDNLQMRLNQLEVARASSDGERAALQSDLDALRQDMSAFEQSLARLDAMDGQIASLSDWLSYSSTQVMGMRDSLQDPAGELGGLRREVARLKALNLLTRAQVHLAQNNFGLARDDSAMARAVLAELRASTPAAELAQVDAWIARLDLALANLPAYPVLAAGDLEQAYQMIASAVQSGAQAAALAGTETPTPATWLTETAAALTATPTSYPTVTPDPTQATPTPTRVQ